MTVCIQCQYCLMHSDTYAKELENSGVRTLFECLHPLSPIMLTCIYREGSLDIIENLHTYSCKFAGGEADGNCYTCSYHRERDGYNSCIAGFLFKPFADLTEFSCSQYARK